MIDDTLLEAEEKMDKAVTVAKEEFGENSKRYKELQTRLDSMKSQLEEHEGGSKERAIEAIKGAEGKRLSYRDPIGR